MSIKSINVRNQFRGTISEIIEGPVLSEIDVSTPSGIVTSVITTRSVKASHYTHLPALYPIVLNGDHTERADELGEAGV